MIKRDNYPNAYKEVYVILNNMEPTAVATIPESFIKMIKQNMNYNYSFNYNINKNLDEQNVLRETRVILAYIFLHYWSNVEQKKRIEQKFKQDILKEENQKREKYNPDSIFKNEEFINNTKEETQLVVYKKENMFIRFLNKLKYIFKVKK